ncbi:MAG TPA: hypothetical protein PKD90_06075, partial [Phnomibacter sp.]|nr:hypothetical protein [Phnomibacter sp.]
LCIRWLTGMSQHMWPSWLQQQGISVQASLTQYDPQQYNLRQVHFATTVMQPKQLLNVSSTQWEVRMQVTPVGSQSLQCRVVFYCQQGVLADAAAGVDIRFAEWKESNYVLMPAVAYNGNRYPWRRLRYSPKLYEIQDIGIDKGIILTDVPKLSENGGFSRIQQRSGDFSTPAVGFYDDMEQRCVWMLTEQENNLGDYGISFAESRDRKTATASLISPLVREQFVYKNCDNHYPSWDMPATFKAGDSVVFVFRLYVQTAQRLQNLFDAFAGIRKSMANDTSLRPSLSYAACMQVLEHKFNTINFVPAHGYYSVGLRENFLQDWQIGWTGGLISTYPLLFAGADSTVHNVIRNFDWVFPNGISPSGFYWDAGRNGTEWLGGDIRKPHTGNWHLVRKSGDGIWYITRQLMLMEKKGMLVRESWKAGNKGVCDAFVRLWKKYGQLGQFVNSLTGEIIVGGSTSGGIVPAGLAVAAQYYDEPAYLETAKQIGQYYYDNFTQKGLTCGGPGDAVQNFDSESSAALIESYVTLYEATLDRKWLQMGLEAVRQFATWMVSYNYRFHDTTAYGRAGIGVMGSVYANTQNKHTAPGICTGSGVGMLKLYHYTGDNSSLELLRDMAFHIPQYLAHPLKPLGKLPVGFVSERVNINDWEGPETIGYVLPITTWAETSLMLTTVELPGLLVETHKGKVTAFDNVLVKVEENTKKEFVISVFNPTQVKANVRLMEINKTRDLLGENFTFGLPSIELEPGQTIIKRFRKANR